MSMSSDDNSSKVISLSDGESRLCSDCGANTEVCVVEDGMRVLEGFFGCDICDFLLDVNDSFWVLDDEWDFQIDRVLFNFPDGYFFKGVYFIWYLNCFGVMLPNFVDVWLLDDNFKENLLPLGLLKFVLNGVWLFLILGYGDLLGDDVWHLLDDDVVHSLSDFIWHFEFFLIWDFVVDCVRDLLSDNVWNRVGDSVRHFSAGDIWDLDLNFVWDLFFDGVWDFFDDFICLKGLNLVLFGNVVGYCDLVWNLCFNKFWDLLGDLELLSHVFGDIVVVLIRRGIRCYIVQLSVLVSVSVFRRGLRIKVIARVVGVVS